MRQIHLLALMGVLLAALWAKPFRAEGQQSQTQNPAEGTRADGKGDRTRQTPPRISATAIRQVPAGEKHPDGKGDVVRPGRPKGRASGPATGNGIDYHGGPVILGTTKMCYIWYGNWTGNNAPAISILTNLAQHIGGSPYFNINTTYANGAGQAVSNSVAFAGSATDNYSRGSSLGDNDIATIVTSAISTGGLPKDSNGVYFVLTSPDVRETSGFCTIYCGWHTSGTILGADIKYAFVGDADQCRRRVRHRVRDRTARLGRTRWPRSWRTNWRRRGPIPT